MKKVWINEMSWTEFRDAMANNDLVIIPVGVTEEHGRHNPLGTDTYIAEAAAYEIGVKSGYPVAPCMRYGYSPSVVEFTGTISLSASIFKRLMIAYCESFIQHGAKRFLFVNGHGGNDNTLSSVSADLFDKHGVISSHSEWWEQLPSINKEWTCADHGGFYETSFMMAVRPETVRMDLADFGPVNPGIPGMENGKYKGARIGLSSSLWKLNKIGNTGIAPYDATPENGRKMIDAYVDFCVAFAHELRKVDLTECFVK